MGYCFNIKMLYQHFSLVGFLLFLPSEIRSVGP